MQAVEVKLPFGLNEDNILVHIGSVESGKKCRCFCPSCRSPLIGAKGKIKQHHFKHAVDNGCEGGLESAIHWAAKQIILERRQITLPEFVAKVSAPDSRAIEHTEQETVVCDGTVICFDLVEEEIELHEMKVDILATVSNKPLIIEILYRHKVDDQKREKMAKANISAIEIDLSDLRQEDVKDWETFWLCINDSQRVRWLHNSKAHDRVYRKLGTKLAERIEAQEKCYDQEEIRKQRQEESEKAQLLKALEELMIVRNKEHAAQLRRKAESHRAWSRHSECLQLRLPELPNFLNAVVPDGDWIFGCDRRVWQTAFYSSFICNTGKPFSVKRVDTWLQTEGCNVPRCAEIVGIYGRRYPQLVPANISVNLPSSLRTLGAYFDYLEDLGILRFSGNDLRYWGSSWFQVVSKTPLVARHP